jgi:hypothetical protein
MSLSIFTFAHKRPDFIELQYRSIIQHVKCPYRFVVFNNAVDDSEQRNAINIVCNSLGIEVVSVELDPRMQVTSGVLNFIDQRYVSPNVACSYSLMWAFEHYVSDEKQICILDSDMFFIANIDLSAVIDSLDICYIPQYRQSHMVQYIWNGIVLLNLDRRSDLRELDWSPAPLNGENMDVGSLTSRIIQRNVLSSRYFEQLTVFDVKVSIEGVETLSIIINGNINFDIVVNSNSRSISVRHTGGELFSSSKAFRHHLDSATYWSSLVNRSRGLLKMIDGLSSKFPTPIQTGFIGLQDFDEPFICHYTAGSNYLPYQTDSYNSAKTAAISQLIGSRAAFPHISV